jgi:hypothetical protein
MANVELVTRRYGSQDTHDCGSVEDALVLAEAFMDDGELWPVAVRVDGQVVLDEAGIDARLYPPPSPEEQARAEAEQARIRAERERLAVEVQTRLAALPPGWRWDLFTHRVDVQVMSQVPARSVVTGYTAHGVAPDGREWRASGAEPAACLANVLDQAAAEGALPFRMAGSR